MAITIKITPNHLSIDKLDKIVPKRPLLLYLTLHALRPDTTRCISPLGGAAASISIVVDTNQHTVALVHLHEASEIADLFIIMIKCVGSTTLISPVQSRRRSIDRSTWMARDTNPSPFAAAAPSNISRSKLRHTVPRRSMAIASQPVR